MPNNEGNHPGAEQHPIPVDRIPAPGPAPTCIPEQVTPHRISTLAFILEYLQPKRPHSLDPSDKTRICLFLLNLIQFPDENLKSTCQRLIPSVPRPLLACWATRLIGIQEKGIAGLMDLFQAVEKLILDAQVLNKISIVGVLLRRVYLQFDKMSFSQVSSLQIMFSSYFSTGSEILNKLVQEGNNDSDCELDLSLDDYNLPTALPSDYRSLETKEETKLMTRRQADLFIARQANLIQHSEGHALSPLELQRELNVIVKTNPGLSEAYFLSYLNSLRMHEFVGAVDSLFAASNHILSSTNSKLSLEDSRKSFRYADLNLASLHARFGHNSESLAAVKEAIAIGQEAKDHAALQHALSWLTRVSPGDSIALLQRSISKCEKLSLPYLASLGMLSLCKHVDEFGDRPGYILDVLTRSAVINCKHNLMELQANSFLVRSNVWASWGRPMMSQTVNQLLLQLNSTENNKDGINYQGECTVLGLVNTALSLEQEGYRTEADTLIKTCEKLFPCPTSQYSKVWKTARERIEFARAILSGNWVQAESALDLLFSNIPEFDLYKAELLFKQGNLEQSRDILKTIVSSYSKVDLSRPALSCTLSKETLVRALIILSDIQTACNDLGGSIEHLLVAESLSAKYRLEYLHCLICLQIANNQLTLGCPARALQLVKHCLTYLLAHGTKRDRSRGLLMLAKCKVAASSDLVPVQRRMELLEGAEQVGRAKEGFIQINDWDRVKDCLYLQARIYHTLVLTEERNLAAQQFKKFDEMHPSSSPIPHLLLI